MKKLFLTSIAMVALSAGGSAVAADMPVKARPAPPPVYSWSGCYGGGFVGYGWVIVSIAPGSSRTFDERCEWGSATATANPG